MKAHWLDEVELLKVRSGEVLIRRDGNVTYADFITARKVREACTTVDEMLQELATLPPKDTP